MDTIESVNEAALDLVVGGLMSISPPGTGEQGRLRLRATRPVPTQSLDIRYRSTKPLCAASGMPAIGFISVGRRRK
jgi:hypothetical protein